MMSWMGLIVADMDMGQVSPPFESECEWNGRRELYVRSVGGAKAGQLTGPIEDSLVGGYEAVTCQGGRDDQAICRVSMKIGEPHGSDTNLTVNGDFHHTLFQVFPTP